MAQIRATQIIPVRELEQNPYVSPPRDLALNTKEGNGTAAPKTSLTVPLAPAGENIAPVVTPGGLNNYGEGLNDAAQPPAVPHIISVKQQIVNIHDDGTSTIDVILNVEDVKGVTEYDIRVAKDAGNL